MLNSIAFHTNEKTQFQDMEDFFEQHLGSEKFKQLPVLAYKKEFCSGEYIECILPQDVSHSIMKGIDERGRRFYTLRWTDERNGSVCVTTLFQRYANTSWPWVTGGCGNRLGACDLLEGHSSHGIFVKGDPTGALDYLERLLKAEPCGRCQFGKEEERTTQTGKSVIVLC